MVLPKYDSKGSTASAANVSKHEKIKFVGSGNVGRAASYSGGDPINQSLAEYGGDVSGNITNGAGSLAAITFDQLRISKSMAQKFGTQADPIKVNADTLFIDSPRSEVHINGSFNRVIIARIPRVLTISGDGATRKGIRELIVTGDRGRVNITDATRIDRMFVYGEGVEVVLDDDCENFSGGAAETGLLEMRVARGSRILAGSNSNKIVNAGGFVRFSTTVELVQFGDSAATEFTGLIEGGKIFDGQIGAFTTDALTPRFGQVDIFDVDVISTKNAITSNSSGSFIPTFHGDANLRLVNGSTVTVE